MNLRLRWWIWLLGVLWLAMLTRLPRLDVRPMHADEAVLADKTGTLVEKGVFQYDPNDYHGPVLEYLAALSTRAAGLHHYRDFTEGSLRIVSVLAGILLVLAAFRFSAYSALFLALSPAAVYYSRYFIPEMLLALFSAAMLVSLLEYNREKEARWIAAAGICFGLMLASKETAVISLAALSAAAARVRLTHKLYFCLAALFLLLAVFRQDLPLLAVSLFQSAANVLAGTHRHPWHYYFWTLRAEIPLMILAVIGGYHCWRSNLFLCLYAGSMTSLYAIFPYKTPWCALQFFVPLLFLAGKGAEWLLDKYKNYAILGLAFLALELGWVTWRTSFVIPASPENPYAYAQTLPDTLLLRDRLHSLVVGHPETPIQIFSIENPWPLPWYLRSFERQQWAKGIPPNFEPAPIILATPEMEPKITEWLYENRPPGARDLYMNLTRTPLYLRPGIEIRAYVRHAAFGAKLAELDQGENKH